MTLKELMLLANRETAGVDEPCAPAVDPSLVDLEGNPTDLTGGESARLRRYVMHEIDTAFDGVPPPDVDHRTLYQAQGCDHGEDYDQSRDHLGRWQDLPESHLKDCPSAMSWLDAQGLRYYLPAVMTGRLRHELEVDAHWEPGRRRRPAREYPSVYDNLLDWTLRPGRYDRRRASTASRMRLLTPRQRLAIAHFVEVSASSEQVDIVEAWERVVAFDARDGTRDDAEDFAWFDVFWPPQARPSSSAVRALIDSAFVPGESCSSGPLHSAAGADFRERMRVAMLRHLEELDADPSPLPREPGTLEKILDVGSWRGSVEADHRRLDGLTQPQRAAVLSYLQRCSSDGDIIEAWGRAVVTSDDWFEALRGSRRRSPS